MSTYLVTGVARGLGFEFIRQLSEDPANTIFGLVRNKEETDKKVAAEINRKNIHIIQADVTDYDALKRAVAYVSSATGGSLDYIIANAALAGDWSSMRNFGELKEEPARLEEDLLNHYKINVVGTIHLYNLFTPLILKGRAKKVIAISTGMADLDLVNNYAIDQGAPYSISKAALNMAVAKFNAEYHESGVLFMGISPGFVDTHPSNEPVPDEVMQQITKLVTAFQKYAPHFTGAITPEASVKAVLSVIENASLEKGDGGAFISHLGNKQWL